MTTAEVPSNSQLEYETLRPCPTASVADPAVTAIATSIASNRMARTRRHCLPEFTVGCRRTGDRAIIGLTIACQFPGVSNMQQWKRCEKHASIIDLSKTLVAVQSSKIVLPDSKLAVSRESIDSTLRETQVVLQFPDRHQKSRSLPVCGIFLFGIRLDRPGIGSAEPATARVSAPRADRPAGQSLRTGSHIFGSARRLAARWRVSLGADACPVFVSGTASLLTHLVEGKHPAVLHSLFELGLSSNFAG